jgi:choline dehydrogenase-like flavoprotein
MTTPVDVLIIGAGASGAAVAWSLAETKMHILCLEQGDWMKPSEYPSTARDWEARQFDDFHISPNRRARETDYPINDSGSPIKIANFNGVGGGTVLYAGHFPRFHPSDFRVRTLDGVADDWPIDYATLEPFYAENDRVMGVSGLAGDPAYPPHEPMMPPLPLGKSGTALARGLNNLGWHWWPSDSAIASVEYEGRAKCINLGHCTSGCAQGAKASTDITYWPAAIRAGVELKTRCRVREITTNEHGMASGVVYYDAEGVEHFQPAEVVVLACNAVGTARILLNSASAAFPNGLANSSGLVGKNLMFHPYARIAGWFDEELDGHRGPGNCIWSQEFYETDRSRGFVRGYTFEFSRGQGS